MATFCSKRFSSFALTLFLLTSLTRITAAFMHSAPATKKSLLTRSPLTGERPKAAQGSFFRTSSRVGSTPSPSTSLLDNSTTKTTPETPPLTNAESSDISAEPVARLKPWQSTLTRIGMIAYIAAMCIALPLTLLPQKLAYKLGYMTESEKERLALSTGQFCARWLLRLIPFCRITGYAHHQPIPPASIWVCNHASMLDVFVLLAADKQLRGRTRRRIKIVYWKQLEKNPVSKLLFRQAGFIPVEMAANKAGEDNAYDKRSFKQLLKSSKKAFADGFDIGILPEGQLNPTPEKGLMPVFSGAFTLARISKRPVQMMALKGVHDLWHPEKGMHCVGRHIKLRVYPHIWRFSNSANFADAFTQVVENFTLHGTDIPEEKMASYIVQNSLGSAAPTKSSAKSSGATKKESNDISK